MNRAARKWTLWFLITEDYGKKEKTSWNNNSFFSLEFSLHKKLSTFGEFFLIENYMELKKNWTGEGGHVPLEPLWIRPCSVILSTKYDIPINRTNCGTRWCYWHSWFYLMQMVLFLFLLTTCCINNSMHNNSCIMCNNLLSRCICIMLLNGLSFNCTLWTIKQQLTLKIWARCRVSIIVP